MGVSLRRKRESSSFPPAMEVVMVMVALVLLINPSSCGASFVLKSNVTNYRQCINSGAMDACLIAEDLDLDFDFDFFMDTHVVRIILDETDKQQGNSNSYATLNANRAVCNHGRGQKSNCDAQPGRGGGKKNPYHR